MFSSIVVCGLVYICICVCILFLDTAKGSRTKRMSLPQLFEKRLMQKQEHEIKKQKRHDDRMAMEQKLIDTLTKYLDK